MYSDKPHVAWIPAQVCFCNRTFNHKCQYADSLAKQCNAACKVIVTPKQMLLNTHEESFLEGSHALTAHQLQPAASSAERKARVPTCRHLSNGTAVKGCEGDSLCSKTYLHTAYFPFSPCFPLHFHSYDSKAQRALLNKSWECLWKEKIVHLSPKEHRHACCHCCEMVRRPESN
jgi:hypothetical protein